MTQNIASAAATVSRSPGSCNSDDDTYLHIILWPVTQHLVQMSFIVDRQKQAPEMDRQILKNGFLSLQHKYFSMSVLV